MAPKSWPDEVDVFTVPHSRMKELVQKYLNMMSNINFSNAKHLTTLLENLGNTFKEFHNHEQVENQFIMKKLKAKLKNLSIKNHAVCNCHSDNRMTEMLDLLQDGYKCTQKTDADRINYGIKLRTALQDFTDNFLPHMEEEEEIFQPMLIKYFSYDELCDIKHEVLIHQGISPSQKEDQVDEKEFICEDFQEKEDLEKSEKEVKFTGIDTLPEELMLKIFSHLNPRELCRCAQVSQRWNELATDGSLWKTLRPVQWSRGQWSFEPGLDSDAEEDKVSVAKELMADVLSDEDADLDESEGDDSDSATDHECAEDKQIRKEAAMLTSLVKYLLPRIGSHVRSCYLGYSKGLINGLLYKILSQCPNLEILDLAQTRISDIAFKGLGRKGCGGMLKYLNLAGCLNITDVTLKRLSSAFGVLGNSSVQEMAGEKLEKNDMEKNEKDRNRNMNEKYDKCDKEKHMKDNLKEDKDFEMSSVLKTMHSDDTDKVAFNVSVDLPTHNNVNQKQSCDIVPKSPIVSNLKTKVDILITVPIDSVFPEVVDKNDTKLIQSLSDTNVSKALQQACDYLEGLMDNRGGNLGETKATIANYNCDEKDFDTMDESAVQCVESGTVHRPMRNSSFSDVGQYFDVGSSADSVKLHKMAATENCHLTRQDVETVTQQSQSSTCLECCCSRKMSSKHSVEPDVLGLHLQQTSLKFHESKKPKRTTNGFLGNQNTNIQEADSPGNVRTTTVKLAYTSSDWKYCDIDLDDPCVEVVNSDPCFRGLEYLSLSGCYHITDTGLRYLAEEGGLPSLRYLDLSGCLNITADGLTELVSTCPTLDREELYYCDNVIDGPYAAEASGCQNLECNSRVCCRSGY